MLSFNLKGGNAHFPPADAHGQKWWRHFLKNLGKMHKFWSRGLGVFDEVSVSSRNFNQVSVSKVMISTNHCHQRWPESLFQTPTLLLFQNFWIRIRIRVRLFFKFQNPTPVQTPATINDPTIIYPYFYLRNDHTDSYYCRNGKVTPDSGPVFPKYLTPGPDPSPKEKRRILLESTSDR